MDDAPASSRRRGSHHPVSSSFVPPSVIWSEPCAGSGVCLGFEINSQQGGHMAPQAANLRAFNQGETPTIACFNKATTPLGVDLDALISAMQSFVDNYV